MRRSSLRSCVVCAVASLALSLASATAHADESDDAIARGIQLRRERRDAEALEQFQLAQKLRSSPKAIAQAGLAEQALGRWVDAERDLTAALNADADPWIVEHREVLTKALGNVRARLGTLELRSNAPNAEVWVNGVQSGTLPASLRLVVGKIEIEVRAPGYVAERQMVSVTADDSVELEVPLDSATKESAPGAAPPTPTPTPVPRDTAPLESNAPARVETPDRTWAWVALGGSVAFVAGGVASTLIHERAASEYNDDSVCFYGTQTRDQRCGKYRSRANWSGPLAVAGYSAGALLGGLSVYLFLNAKPRDSAPKLGLSAGPEQASVVYGGSF